MVDGDIYASKVEVDRTSMNSTITIEDSEEEVIDLDSSQEAATVCDHVKSKCAVQSESSANSEDRTGNVDFEDKEAKCTEETVSKHCDDKQTSTPLFKVMFRDESIARQYREQIKNFFENLVALKCQESDTSSSNLILEIWGDSKDKKKEDVNDSLFTVDTQPKLTDDLDVPTYGKKYDVHAFDKDHTNENKKSKDTCVSPKVLCFNCEGNHNLRDCPNPRNQAVINKNRKEFSGKANNKLTRYHSEDDQRFGHMIPGQLSKNLRKALGLKDNELPKHIYRMRILGYPPGWLEEARLQHSGLSLFNSDGVAENDPNDEPGEIVVEGDKDQYDIKKIYDFPGFNVPTPPDTHDDYKQYWQPHVQAMHSKETMLLMLRGKKADDGYKRKKLKLSATSTAESEVNPCEMEIEDTEECVVESVSVNGYFIPPLPKESKESPAKPGPPSVPQPISEDSDCQSQELQSPDSADESTSSLANSRANSPSLSELESMKKRLLVELEDSSSQSNSDTPSKNGTPNSSFKADMPPPSNVLNDSTSSQNMQSTSAGNHGSIKSVDLGTPILHSTSPYSKLPSSEKFSKNICDVINFENLPDSTGKYEQMTGVLQKVRKVLAKIHKE